MPGSQTTPLHVVVRAEARDARLRALGYADYATYLHSPAWRSVRRRYAEENPWLCNVCGADNALHLHHKTYERVGRERSADLMPLCENCHQMVHALERRGDVSLDFEGVVDEVRAVVGRRLLAQQREDRDAEDVATRATARDQMDALPMDERLRRARKVANRRYVDLSRELWALKVIMLQRRPPKSLWRQLERIERKAYGPEYWGEAA